MSDDLRNIPTNQTIYGSRNPTGINRTGLMYGNPISSYDINSLQNNLINLMASYSSGSGGSTASIDLEGWGTSQLADRLTKIHNIRATINVSSRGETYFIYCPSLSLNLPSSDNDQYLKLYYRIVAYVSDSSRTKYEQTGNILPTADRIFKYGYIQSPSTATPAEELPNDIADNEMDSEVSVRLGIQWTLSWENDSKLLGYTEGPIVALYRYKSSSARFIFNTSRQLAYNSNIVSIPTVYAKTIGSYIILDGVYDMLMTNTDESIFMAQVVFDRSFAIDSEKHIVIGVKNAADISLEYRLLDGTVIISGSKWVVGRWEANKAYLMNFMGGTMSYTDPSTVVQRKLRHYKYNDSTGEITTSTGTFNADFMLDSSGKFRCVANKVYTVNGVDHYFDGSNWKTCVPAGVLSISARYGTNPRHGTLLCNGKSYKKSDYPELDYYLGGVFGGTDTTFKIPSYNNLYLRGTTSSITVGNKTGGSDTVGLNVNNIPAMTVSFDSYTITKTGASSETSKTITPTVKSWDNNTLKSVIAKNNANLKTAILTHSHYSGVSNDTAASGDGNNPVIASSTKVSAGSYPGGSSMWPAASYPLRGKCGVESDQNSNQKYMGVTSKAIDQSSLINLPAIEGSVSGSPKITMNSSTIDIAHTHPVTIPAKSATVGTASKDKKDITVMPAYAYVGICIYIGRSLVLDEDMVIENIPTDPGNLYSAPTVSAELYARTVNSD